MAWKGFLAVAAACSLSFSGAVPTAIARVGRRHGSRSLELEFRLLNLSGSSDSGQAHSASFFFLFLLYFYRCQPELTVGGIIDT